MKVIWIFFAAVLLVGCHNDDKVPRADDRVRTEQGNKGATPNQSFTVSNSSQQTSVPREGGNLDRGVTKSNDPSRYAPGAEGRSPTSVGPGTGPATK